MNMQHFYETYLKNNGDFDDFLVSFFEILLPDEDVNKYKQCLLEYFFYDKNDFVHILQYKAFQKCDSKYIKNVMTKFRDKNSTWVEKLLQVDSDKDEIVKVLTMLGNKKIELLQSIVLPSFQSFENDIDNGEIVQNISNSILDNMQKMQYNQNMMLANISHEMRTPLNSVIGYLDILGETVTLLNEDRKKISYAKNSSKVLLSLINDLLDTQKLANAKLDILNNPFWINKIIKNAFLISNISATQKNIEFVYKDETKIFSEVLGDKNRFLQILNNLFSNAIKFTPEKGCVKVVAKTEELNKSVKVLLTIQDSGIGIPKNKQKELFQPFSRATNKEKGTGLGLYISKQLAKKMGGDIWFESVEGVGTTFYLELLFQKKNITYDKEILKNRKILVLRNHKSLFYCKNIKSQVESLGGKVKILEDEAEFVNTILFSKDIDMSIIVYPNNIEKDDLDKSFIKTYKKVNKLSHHFIACTEEGSYPKNAEVFDKIISTPITLLDIMETFAQPTNFNKNYKYLIIDDEPLNRQVLKSMIQTFDKYAVIETANNGALGLEKLQNVKYDVVFLDKRMPEMGGYQVLEELDKLNIKANIYLLTADGDDETIQKAKQYNVGYLAKPVSLSVLKSVVSEVSGGGR